MPCGLAELSKYPQEMGAVGVRVVGGKLDFFKVRKDRYKVRGDLLLELASQQKTGGKIN